jgi:hypothetical protein
MPSRSNTRSIQLSAGLLLLLILGCKAAQEQATVPRFPYPDGGLVDVYRRPMPDAGSTDVPLMIEVNGPADVSASDVPITSYKDAGPKDGGLSVDVSSPCPASCDDQNPCTLDSCDELTGSCNNRPMDENSPCANSCLAGGKGTCKAGLCSGNAASDGTACEDLNPCTVNDVCKGGVCYSGTEKTCAPVNNCHEDGYCDRRTGQCVDVAASDGKKCDDGLVCTTGDRCTTGLCGGVALACASGATCGETTGICQAGGTVTFPSATLAATWNGVRFGAPGSLALGPQQDLFAVGTLTAATDLGAGAIAKSASGNDLLVAKINPDTGMATWAKSFGDDRDQSGSAIAVNGKGQVVVSGIFGGTLALGKSSLSSPGVTTDPDAFVAAVDAASGAGLWALRPMVNGKGPAVAADPVGHDFVVCGTAAGHAAVGLAATASKADEGEIVVARLDAATGDVVWGRQISASGVQTCDRVAFDSSGHLFLAGTMSSLPSGNADAGTDGDVDFGSGVTLSSPSAPASGSVAVGWVANLDMTNGKALNAVRFGDKGTHVIHGLACDSAGHVMVAGGFRSRLAFGSSDLSTGSFQNAFALKLNAQLAPQWSKGWSGGGTAMVAQIAAESSGTLIIVGSYTKSLVLDDVAIALGAASGLSGFVARLDGGTGKVLSARGYGAPGINQDSTGLQVVVASHAASGVWYAGGFAGTLQLGPPAATLIRGDAAQSLVGFVGKLAP